MNQELVPLSPAPVARSDSPFPTLNIEGLLEKAVDAKSAVEVIERLQVMRREMRAEQAKEAYDRAMAAFQADCPVIVKQKGVPDRSGGVAYRYAPLEDIVAQIKPFLLKHGFSYTLDTDVTSEAGWVIAKCIITHCAGHQSISSAKFPLGTKTGIMSDTQVYAAALTFASRRVLCNAFGIVVAGEDSEERMAKIKPRGPSALSGEGNAKALVAEIWSLLEPVRGKERNWKVANQWLVDEAITTDTEFMPDLPPERLRVIIEKIKAKLGR